MTNLTTAVTSAQSDLAASIDRASLRNDPYSHVLRALSDTIGLFPDIVAEMRATAADARQPLDAEALARMEAAAAEGASRAAQGLARAYTRRSVLVGALALVGCLVGGAAGGYWWGHADAIQRFSLSETGFAAMMHDDPEAATGWLKIVRLNDYQQVIAACHGDRVTVQAGQKACEVALWMGEAAPAPARGH